MSTINGQSALRMSTTTNGQSAHRTTNGQSIHRPTPSRARTSGATAKERGKAALTAKPLLRQAGEDKENALRHSPNGVPTAKTTKRESHVSTSSGASGNSDIKRKTQIGPWRLGKTLGRGSSGRVRLAKHVQTGQMAAVKIVPKMAKKPLVPVVATGAKGKEKDVNPLSHGMEREVVIMKLIDHPNVMRLHDVWENKGELYLVLEYVEGGELFDYLVRKGKLEEREASHYFQQIIAGVDYCHRFNICHRDLKPENLLLDKDKNIKIADFGMAALQPFDSLLETSCGSPHYASPEIVAGKTYHGAPSDIWSCGIILFALLTGHLPFDDDDIRKLLFKVKAAKFVMPPDLSEEAQDLIRRMLDANPNTRIKMPNIFQHPFVTKYPNKNPIPKPPSYQLLDRPVEKTSDIDPEILRNLMTLWKGVRRETIVRKLLAHESNSEKIFYCLLLRYRQNYLDKVSETAASNSSSNNAAPELSALEPKPVRKSVSARSILSQHSAKRPTSNGLGHRRKQGSRSSLVHRPAVIFPSNVVSSTKKQGDCSEDNPQQEIMPLPETETEVTKTKQQRTPSDVATVNSPTKLLREQVSREFAEEIDVAFSKRQTKDLPVELPDPTEPIYRRPLPSPPRSPIKDKPASPARTTMNRPLTEYHYMDDVIKHLDRIGNSTNRTFALEPRKDKLNRPLSMIYEEDQFADAEEGEQAPAKNSQMATRMPLLSLNENALNIQGIATGADHLSGPNNFKESANDRLAYGSRLQLSKIYHPNSLPLPSIERFPSPERRVISSPNRPLPPNEDIPRPVKGSKFGFSLLKKKNKFELLPQRDPPKPPTRIDCSETPRIPMPLHLRSEDWSVKDSGIASPVLLPSSPKPNKPQGGGAHQIRPLSTKTRRVSYTNWHADPPSISASVEQPSIIHSWFSKLFHNVKPLSQSIEVMKPRTEAHLELLDLLVGWENMNIGVTPVTVERVTGIVRARLVKGNAVGLKPIKIRIEVIPEGAKKARFNFYHEQGSTSAFPKIVERIQREMENRNKSRKRTSRRETTAI